jgi:hypothetical protein
MARDQAVGDDELELDQDGFAGPPARAEQAPKRHRSNGGNGNSNPWRRNGNGNGDEDTQSELARLRAERDALRAERDRLRAVAGLEARREEPATVGDVLDATSAQTELVRAEVQRALDEHGEEMADYVAECVERRLLEPLGLADEQDEDADSEAAAKQNPNGKANKTQPKTRLLEPDEEYIGADNRLHISNGGPLPEGARFYHD